MYTLYPHDGENSPWVVPDCVGGAGAGKAHGIQGGRVPELANGDGL